MYTNGNFAERVNEKGYDVVTKDNERISVKITRDARHSHNSRKDAKGCLCLAY